MTYMDNAHRKRGSKILKLDTTLFEVVSISIKVKYCKP